MVRNRRVQAFVGMAGRPHKGGSWRGAGIMAGQHMWVLLPLLLSGEPLPAVLYLPKLQIWFYTRPSRKDQECIDVTSAQPPWTRAGHCLRTWISICSGCFFIFNNNLKMPTSTSGAQPQDGRKYRDPENWCERETKSWLPPHSPNSAACSFLRVPESAVPLLFLIYPIFTRMIFLILTTLPKNLHCLSL